MHIYIDIIQISMNVKGEMDVAALRHVAIQLAATPALATVDTREMATHVQVSNLLANERSERTDSLIMLSRKFNVCLGFVANHMHMSI